MPSTLIVPVATISNIRPHPNADRLEIVEVLGWQCCVAKGDYAIGDPVVYFPPDCVLPDSVAETLGVAQYLSNGRVKIVKLRGEVSMGFVIHAPSEIPIGQNVAEQFNATKYEPPVRAAQAGPVSNEHPLFVRYTSIENIRHYPAVLEGMEVVATEKIHGTNARVGRIDGELVCGSHKTQRKIDDPFYVFPLRLNSITTFLNSYGSSIQTILFGEIYGKGIQNLTYGVERGFRVFDIFIDGKYLDYDHMLSICIEYGIETVPELYVGTFDSAIISNLTTGTSTLAEHIREGLVVRPLKEQWLHRCGRVIFKSINNDYLLSKHSDYKEE